MGRDLDYRIPKHDVEKAEKRMRDVAGRLIDNILGMVEFKSIVDSNISDLPVPGLAGEIASKIHTISGEVVRDELRFDMTLALHFTGDTVATLIRDPNARHVNYYEVAFGNGVTLSDFLDIIAKTLKNGPKRSNLPEMNNRTEGLELGDETSDSKVEVVDITPQTVRLYDKTQNTIFDVKTDTAITNGVYPNKRAFLHEAVVYSNTFGIIAGDNENIENAIKARQLIVNPLSNVRPVDVMYKLPRYLSAGYTLDYESYGLLIAKIAEVGVKGLTKTQYFNATSEAAKDAVKQAITQNQEKDIQVLTRTTIPEEESYPVVGIDGRLKENGTP